MLPRLDGGAHRACLLYSALNGDSALRAAPAGRLGHGGMQGCSRGPDLLPVGHILVNHVVNRPRTVDLIPMSGTDMDRLDPLI